MNENIKLPEIFPHKQNKITVNIFENKITPGPKFILTYLKLCFEFYDGLNH